MSAILAIDTSSRDWIAAALCEADGSGERVIQLQGPQDHTQRLLPAIAELLEGRMDALAAIVVVRGPGSFAGLRVGIAVAQGLAIARGLPVSGVATLEAVAAAAGGDGTAIHPLGRDEFAVQRFAGGVPQGQPVITPGPQLEGSRGLAGEGAEAFGGRAIAARDRCLAALRLAVAGGRQGEGADAIYLREPKITPPRRSALRGG